MRVKICSTIVQVSHIYQQIQPNPAEYAAIQQLTKQMIQRRDTSQQLIEQMIIDKKRNTTYACSLKDAQSATASIFGMLHL